MCKFCIIFATTNSYRILVLLLSHRIRGGWAMGVQKDNRKNTPIHTQTIWRTDGPIWFGQMDEIRKIH